METVFRCEALAFYSSFTPERAETLRQYVSPDWVVAAFEGGECVASVRTVPMYRRMNGAGTRFGGIGPVACLAGHRRRGHVGTLLKMSLETMRDRGQTLAGLYTPHDALYQRYGWERAEGRKDYSFFPKDVTLRFKGARGRLEQLGVDDWQRVDAIYRAWGIPRNGTMERSEPWWRASILTTFDGKMKQMPREIFVWVSESGRDEGYIVYEVTEAPSQHRWPARTIWVRDLYATTSDGYLGLWEHLLTHDLADRVHVFAPLDDAIREVAVNPLAIDARIGEGAMLRVVDVERAFEIRPYAGREPAAFTVRLHDATAPWNDGTWRIEGANSQMRASRVSDPPDVEMTVNILAPLFTGHITPERAAISGMMAVERPDALQEMAKVLAVTYPPYGPDNY
jgi:predicted acetyltransferase